MSLRVWLPLTKDLRNQGLDDMVFNLNSGAIIDNNGKIGKCYSFDGVDDWVRAVHDKTMWNDKPITFACWFKSDASKASGTIMEIAADLCLSYQYNTSGIKFGYWRCYGTNSSDRFGDSNYDTTYYDATKWHHIVLTFVGSLNTLYVDGILSKQWDSSSKYTSNWKPLLGSSYNTVNIGKSSGSSTSWTGGLINDVRIYDHCLSPTEVKQLSQGLVLHYTLGDKAIESTTNLFYPLVETSRNTNPAWDKTLNGNYIIHCNGFGDGYNNGVSNPTKGYHGHWTYDENNILVGILPNLNSVIGQTNRWLGLTASVSPTSIGAGNSYTISWEQKTDNLNCYINTGYYYKKSSSESGYGSFHDGTKNCRNTLINTWQPMEASFTLSQDWDGTYTSGAVYFYGHCGSEGTTYLRNLQFETKNHATAFVDGLTTRTSNIIYDTSGFCNNGTKWAYDTNGVIEIAANTPKYAVSTYINSANNTTNTASGTQYIYGNCELTTPQYLTVAFWCRPIAGYGNNVGQGQFSLTNNDIGDNAASDYLVGPMNHRDDIVDVNSSTGTHKTVAIPFTANEWHHYVVVYDGRYVRVYKDGVAGATADMGSAMTLGSMKGAVIGFSKAGGVWRSNKSYYSDFRLYATALSASDVKSLYQNCATIDPDGTIRGQIRS